jgi:hypothetical protein
MLVTVTLGRRIELALTAVLRRGWFSVSASSGRFFTAMISGKLAVQNVVSVRK